MKSWADDWSLDTVTSAEAKAMAGMLFGGSAAAPSLAGEMILATIDHSLTTDATASGGTMAGAPSDFGSRGMQTDGGSVFTMWSTRTAAPGYPLQVQFDDWQRAAAATWPQTDVETGCKRNGFYLTPKRVGRGPVQIPAGHRYSEFPSRVSKGFRRRSLSQGSDGQL